jgi:hypothetical protein
VVKTQNENWEMTDWELRAAHSITVRNRDRLNRSDICGCFYCLAIFRPVEIESWCDEEQTALCPFCGIDSIMDSVSGYPITDEFLSAMKKHWF